MVSIIIPTYNEEKVLPHTLQGVFRLSGDYEVIVVDGGSSDSTHQIVQAFATRQVLHPIRFLTASKGRASQMNAGATTAGGEWLLFLHADTTLPADAIQRLNKMEPDHAVQAGGFLHKFSGDDWRLKLISFLDNFRCARSHIIYGDQALFIRRRLFDKLGGYPEQPILEDVAFCEKLMKVARPLLLSPPVVTDSRKFIQMGIWRSFARVLAIILHVEWGLPTLSRAFFRDIR